MEPSRGSVCAFRSHRGAESIHQTPRCLLNRSATLQDNRTRATERAPTTLVLFKLETFYICKIYRSDTDRVCRQCLR